MLKNQLLTYLVFPVVFTALLSSSCGEDVAGSETDMGAPTTDLGDAAQDVETDTTTPPGVVRFIHISDIHVHGSPGDVNGTSFDRAPDRGVPRCQVRRLEESCLGTSSGVGLVLVSNAQRRTLSSSTINPIPTGAVSAT